ncbi:MULTISPECIES: Rid family hydrolase [Bradyrhizobium]|uniref:Rid family hydrolase n=1 Tax=Bradyrhizobium TaxID=374 RepID=UPI002ACD42CB|nr:Rid family hydrolase [Bradyrhizobium sp. SEMIA]
MMSTPERQANFAYVISFFDRSPFGSLADLGFTRAACEELLHEVVEHNGGRIVPENTSLDMAGQASDVLGQLSRLLETRESDRSHVLQTTIFVTKLSEKAAFNAAWKHSSLRLLFPHGRSSESLTSPGVKLEMTAIAICRASA